MFSDSRDPFAAVAVGNPRSHHENGHQSSIPGDCLCVARRLLLVARHDNAHARRKASRHGHADTRTRSSTQRRLDCRGRIGLEARGRIACAAGCARGARGPHQRGAEHSLARGALAPTRRAPRAIIEIPRARDCLRAFFCLPQVSRATDRRLDRGRSARKKAPGARALSSHRCERPLPAGRRLRERGVSSLTR